MLRARSPVPPVPSYDDAIAHEPRRMRDRREEEHEETDSGSESENER